MSGPTVKFSVGLKRRQVRAVAPPPQDAAGRHVSKPAAPTSPVTTAARTLALAHFIEREVRIGRWKSYRAAARAMGVCHARVQHVVGLLYLASYVQADVLLSRAEVGERTLRRMALAMVWSKEF